MAGGRGGIGRRTGMRFRRSKTVQVQILSTAVCDECRWNYKVVGSSPARSIIRTLGL